MHLQTATAMLSSKNTDKAMSLKPTRVQIDLCNRKNDNISTMIPITEKETLIYEIEDWKTAWKWLERGLYTFIYCVQKSFPVLGEA